MSLLAIAGSADLSPDVCRAPDGYASASIGRCGDLVIDVPDVTAAVCDITSDRRRWSPLAFDPPQWQRGRHLGQTGNWLAVEP
jgi:hypothetical protein